MILVMAFPLTVNLLPLTKVLWARDIAHQIVEQGDEQQLWLINAEQASEAMILCQQLARGELPDKPQASQQHVASKMEWLAIVRRAPITSGVLLITLVLAFLTGLGSDLEYVAPLSFYPLILLPEPYLVADWQHLLTQPWRLLTPVWLHFGALHLVFNCLWWWDLGRRIEQRQSGQRLLYLLLVTALLSNLAQAWEGTHLFGGLSGVIYGLLGYIWLWDRLHRPVFFLPQAIVIFMLAWLVLGFTGVLTMIGAGNMANMAHLGGLLAGLALAFLVSMIESSAHK
ncbi:MAG: rhomboid family intramembrane serine protease [Gammaproteobacteria bacterium]|jgi:GlpG protein|nr:rhomboid family intramembrane serine protease [Gammaproteobacteria bacterium]